MGNSALTPMPNLIPPLPPPPTLSPLEIARMENVQLEQQISADNIENSANSAKLRAAQNAYAQTNTEYNDEVTAYLAAQKASTQENTKYNTLLNAYNLEKQTANANYNAEKIANLLEISKEEAEKLLAQQLASGLVETDKELSNTEKLLNLQTEQNTILREQLKQKRQENREMLDKISKQDDELAKVELELYQCLQEQQKLRGEIVPTDAPLQFGHVSYPKQSLQFTGKTQYAVQ
jgi:hypothetical protein